MDWQSIVPQQRHVQKAQILPLGIPSSEHLLTTSPMYDCLCALMQELQSALVVAAVLLYTKAPCTTWRELVDYVTDRERTRTFPANRLLPAHSEKLPHYVERACRKTMNGAIRSATVVGRCLREVFNGTFSGNTIIDVDLEFSLSTTHASDMDECLRNCWPVACSMVSAGRLADRVCFNAARPVCVKCDALSLCIYPTPASRSAIWGVRNHLGYTHQLDEVGSCMSAAAQRCADLYCGGAPFKLQSAGRIRLLLALVPEALSASDAAYEFRPLERCPVEILDWFLESLYPFAYRHYESCEPGLCRHVMQAHWELEALHHQELAFADADAWPKETVCSDIYEERAFANFMREWIARFVFHCEGYVKDMMRIVRHARSSGLVEQGYLPPLKPDELEFELAAAQMGGDCLTQLRVLLARHALVRV
jgi:hypothetical protein